MAEIKKGLTWMSRIHRISQGKRIKNFSKQRIFDIIHEMFRMVREIVVPLDK